LGLGVFQTAPEETVAAVSEALRLGYRLIDTAASYGNEREVGQALRASDVDRSEVFLETKLWITDYGYSQAMHGFEKSAAKLGVEQIDLLLLHQPLTSDFEHTLGAYRALEALLGEGLVRAIGVSNMMPDVLERLLNQVEVAPAVNQVEVHPFFSQPAVQEANARHGILTQAWSPIGGITSYRGEATRSTFEDPVLGEIAAEHGRTPAQIMLRWHLQQGRAVIPKSVRPARIAENADVFGFRLTDQDPAPNDALDTRERGGPDPAAVTLETVGREISEACTPARELAVILEDRTRTSAGPQGAVRAPRNPQESPHASPPCRRPARPRPRAHPERLRRWEQRLLRHPHR